jgi:hypothetical protein
VTIVARHVHAEHAQSGEEQDKCGEFEGFHAQLSMSPRAVTAISPVDTTSGRR